MSSEYQKPLTEKGQKNWDNIFNKPKPRKVLERQKDGTYKEREDSQACQKDDTSA